MSEDLKGAILQRDKKTYAIVPRTPAGVLSIENLEAITLVVKKYNIPITKITSGHRLALVGIAKEDIDAVWSDLNIGIGRATELCLHYVQACPGTAVCSFGVQDSLGLGMELEQIFAEKTLPAKFKIGVSGCQFCCGESFVRDIGLVGKKNGWKMIFGGNSGKKPRIGDVVAEDLSKDEVIRIIDSCLAYYLENAKKKERASRFLDRIGVEEFKKAIL
ncbi:MAG: NAD(P)/FAD-dependent oxidoreductase [Desulfobacteraceae bacterium]|nr:NAD(P)/FAD-dependent oxidoreductase [Desulfobacteraceae bacterium]MBC2756634.1 NAD(P)/FAD-dependent oxidoreductase [Desulfobacteraceae bacterium]